MSNEITLNKRKFRKNKLFEESLQYLTKESDKSPKIIIKTCVIAMAEVLKGLDNQINETSK